VNEQSLRIAAAIAAAAVFAYPYVWPAVSGLWAKASRVSSDPVKQKMRDIETILELSSRFAAASSKEGVDLCQKLIDVLLKPSK